ncbi:MAG: VanZ family protein [Woeseiaceae bacterium]|nr:VanZ family protein [Woeseiaceae bacterium]
MAAAVAAFIAVLSLLPGDAWLMTFVTPRMHRAGHFICYALLAGLCAMTLTPAARTWRALAGFLVAACFGIAMELLQRFRRGRTANTTDAMINAAGAATGALVTLAFL